MTQEVEKKTNYLKVLLRGLLLSIILLVFSMLLGFIAVNHLGVFETWLKWRESNYLSLLAWRLTLYGGIIYAWMKLKARLPGVEAGQPSKAQRIEFLVLLLFLIVEISKAPIAWSEVL
ncbi:hypothetical protein [Pseudomonas sichuanensis]|uniref:hypothetical protein n=1 Tax=Pseudomonas sichuanensis TaxID=2213015 RepID=UPI002AB8BEAE|nr:hypothetical protein [Pseudomonas sichuanensis]MDZ4020576.1 hypothetical protein [Pseudomonas sichuanensis]